MAFTNPNAPVIAREFATGNPGTKRIDISSNPANIIDFNTGQPDETLPGQIAVDYDPGTQDASLDINAPELGAGGYAASISMHTNRVAGGAEIFIAADDNISITSKNIVISTQGGFFQIAGDLYAFNTMILVNGWVNDTGYVAKYKIDPLGDVQFQGRVKSGTTGVITNLAARYRPLQTQEFLLKSNGDASTGAWVQVATGGNVTVVGNNAGAALFLSLNSIRYSTL
jgi:hypothetical protein